MITRGFSILIVFTNGERLKFRALDYTYDWHSTADTTPTFTHFAVEMPNQRHVLINAKRIMYVKVSNTFLLDWSRK